MDYKYLLARVIAGYTNTDHVPSYSHLCSLIEKESYRLIWKCPSKVFLLGIMGMIFTTTSGEKWSFDILLLKNTLISLLEDISGVEVTFRDEKWENITLIESDRFRKPNLTHSEGYMSEYFDELF